MGHFITTLYNDGSEFADRQDVFISNNNSQRAGFVDTANGVDVEVGDINGDGTNDIIYYQENIRFVGETFVRPEILPYYGGLQWCGQYLVGYSDYHLKSLPHKHGSRRHQR